MISALNWDAVLVKHGLELAALGNCSDCGSVRGAANFVGGVPTPTPFGTIYSSLQMRLPTPRVNGYEICR